MNLVFNGAWLPRSQRISLCDKRVAQIIFVGNSVRFYFADGFSLQEGDRLTAIASGYVEFCNCDFDDFSCTFFSRKPTKNGAKLYGKPLSLKDVSNLLKENEKQIEITLELYDWNYLYWRGTLLPYKECGLSDWVVIELSDCYPITYYWE